MREYVCIKCGRTYRRKREKPNRLCYQCGYDHMIAEILQLQAREGPYYELWKLGMEKWKHAREAGKGTIRPAG